MCLFSVYEYIVFLNKSWFSNNLIFVQIIRLIHMYMAIMQLDYKLLML